MEVANPAESATKPHKKRQRKTFASVRTLSQVSDLARGLPGYHFVYQPAMLYMEKFHERKEEGLAVFSRYPIVTSHYKLLFKLVRVGIVGATYLGVRALARIVSPVFSHVTGVVGCHRSYGTQCTDTHKASSPTTQII